MLDQERIDVWRAFVRRIIVGLGWISILAAPVMAPYTAGSLQYFDVQHAALYAALLGLGLMILAREIAG